MSRNLIKYPVTREEIIDCLTTLSADIIKEERVGDMRPSLLTLAAEIIAKRRDNKRIYHFRDLDRSRKRNVISNEISPEKP
jgi:xanthine dehydrogenase iron-sulfur cluster and FAD-binding subunit A